MKTTKAKQDGGTFAKIGLAVLFTFWSAELMHAQGLVPATFNTGVDDNAVPLNNYSVDSHYQLITSADPRFPGPQPFVVNDTSFPIVTGDWMASSTNSKWIAPQPDQNYGADPGYGNAVGDYTYRTTFDLSAGDPDLINLIGQWTCDSAGIDILINGVTTSNSIPSTLAVVPRWWHPFSITSGFVQRINT